jgi:uncharacterized protein YggE
MRTKTILWVSLLLTAGLLTACGTTNVYPQAEPPQRTLTVNGVGQVTVSPDVAYVSIGIQTEDPSVGSAVRANNATAQAVVDAIKSFGVEERDITTTNFSVYLQERYDDKGNVVEKTYVVQNTVSVTVRKLDTLGDLLDAVTQAGANAINGVVFDVENRNEVINQARTLAVESARQQAEALAKAAGVTLGEVQSISFYDTVPARLEGKGGGGMDVAASSVPISSGQFDIVATVTITYNLK